MCLLLLFLMFLCGTTAQNCQVDKAGCCMCRAGTVLAAGGDCEEPRCVACELYTYMDEHNKLTTCMSQPYCDPNKNFIYQNSSSSLTYAFFFMDGRHSIRTVEDQSKKNTVYHVSKVRDTIMFKAGHICDLLYAVLAFYRRHRSCLPTGCAS